MLFTLFLVLATGVDQIHIQTSTPSMISFRVEFSEFKKNEQQPIARFVMSDTPPTLNHNWILHSTHQSMATVNRCASVILSYSRM